ncbi:MAG TPA: hypothetical protein VHD15_16365, partial [Hyphomicrobiales bacterium]|nr:hypothetical protein [Hyphomicrobiales bacterium]
MSKRLLAASVSAAALVMASAAYADNNSAYVDQVGTGNTYSVTQTTSGNKLGSGTTYPTYTMHIRQDSTGGTTGNSLTVNQGGGNNNVVGVDYWDGHPSSQVGGNNSATFTQNGGSNVVQRFIQNNDQGTGGANTLAVTQTNGNNNNITDADQYTDGQKIVILQNGSSNGQGADFASSFSKANTITGAVGAGGASIGQGHPMNTAGIYENGNHNSFNVGQDWQNTLISTQTGNYNYIYAVQNTLSTLSNTQSGDSNVLLATQGQGFNDGNINNSIQNDQEGAGGNFAEITQPGIANAAYNTQVGYQNVLHGSQAGESGILYALTYGTRNSVDATQDSNAIGNKLYVYQGTSATSANYNSVVSM